MIRPVAAAVLALAVTLLTSCYGTTGTVAVSSDPYWGAPVFGYGVGYFGPPGAWGGWGPGYFVGPPRWGASTTVVVGTGPRRGFRPAPIGRPMPSVPRGARGVGMRGGPARR
jgi:hypothetical protein